MPNATVLRTEDVPSIDRGGGVRTFQLVTAQMGAESFLNGVTEFEPGSSLPLHSHNCEESVVVLEGQATFEAEGRIYEMNAPDACWVPAGAAHRFWNRGTRRLRILWMYGSTSPTRTLTATGETFPIGGGEDRSIGEKL